MNTKRKFILFFILIIAFIFRFWNYDFRYGIGYDGSRDAIVAFESARQIQLPLTGSFSSIGPITFGPWYYYYITLSTFLIPSMWAPWISIGLASLAMVFVMYKIGSLLLDSNFGLLLALITAVSPAQISASTPLQQHALIGLLSSLILYLFIKVSLKTPRGWQASPPAGGEAMTPPTVKEIGKLSAMWGFLIGVAINTHFQSTGLLSLPIILFIFSNKRRFVFSFILGFFISMIPILVFELNNHWFNTRNIIDYIFIGQYRVWTSNRWLTFLGQFWPEFWSYTTGLPAIVTAVIMFTSGLLFTKKLLQRKLPLPIIIISLSFVAQLVLLRYYRGEKFFGYLQFFHPFIFIFTGYLLFLLFKKIKNKAIITGLLILYLILVLPSGLNFLKPDEFNLETRTRLDYLKTKYPQKKFSTFECKNMYERHRIQGLLVLLYMNKLYDAEGEKITVNNPFCISGKNEVLSHELIDVSNLTENDLKTSGFAEFTPLSVYNETARWWFKEQP